MPMLLVVAIAVYRCAGDDLSQFSMHCLKLGLAASVGYLIGVFQHSPGSASFMPDGEKNLLVERAANAAKQML